MKRSIATMPEIRVECPKCASPEVVLAYQNPWRQCYSCPQCYHIWDITTVTPIVGKTIKTPNVGKTTVEAFRITRADG